MTIAPQTPDRVSIDLPVRNEWGRIDALRASVGNCFAGLYDDLDRSITIALVVGELLENAIKHAAHTDDEHPFHLQVEGDQHGARVSVRNQVEPDGEAVADLLNTLRWIERFASPAEAYRTKLLEVAATPRGHESIRLGLVRIAYEARCRLHATLNANQLMVTADIPAPAHK